MGRISFKPPAEQRRPAPTRLSEEPPPNHVSLSDPLAHDDGLTGAKAAALARAHSLGLPVLPGFAITTATSARLRAQPEALDSIGQTLREPWDELTGGGASALVVRSSSTAEDGATSSMAGMFTSVTDVVGWEAFLDAVVEVVTSSRAPGMTTPAPIAVLVQPFLPAKLGGVMFGVDPVGGRTDRIVVAVADGPPERLVSGAVQGARYVLRPNGRIDEVEAGDATATLGPRRRRALVHLAHEAQRSFGGPQDVEWAIDHDGRLWLLQSRPVTAIASRSEATGPVFGPGPIAESFPNALSPLEEDMWIQPMRAGIRNALLLVRSSPKRRIVASPIITSVDGRPAADLDLLGVLPKKRSLLARLDPRPPARRLTASWNVGRLKAALPGLVERLVVTVDDELAKLPPLCEVTDAGLVDLLTRSRQTLIALHGHEVLAGMLMDAKAGAPTGASIALRSLAEARAAGHSDADILQQNPVVLALVPPAIGRKVVLPPVPARLPDVASESDPLGRARERTRLRVRWVQELVARICDEAGTRLVRAGAIEHESYLHSLSHAELNEALTAHQIPAPTNRRVRGHSDGAPLPAAFRLTREGEVIPEKPDTASNGRGAGGGRGKGTITTDPSAVARGDVLVVRTLDPDLAAVLPELGGLVSETGSVLSHLAILAREFGVPTVVNVAGALERFPAGSTVVVDGTSGEVTTLEDVES